MRVCLWLRIRFYKIAMCLLRCDRAVRELCELDWLSGCLLRGSRLSELFLAELILNFLVS